jgi:hypothetical protein
MTGAENDPTMRVHHLLTKYSCLAIGGGTPVRQHDQCGIKGLHSPMVSSFLLKSYHLSERKPSKNLVLSKISSALLKGGVWGKIFERAFQSGNNIVKFVAFCGKQKRDILERGNGKNSLARAEVLSMSRAC